MATLPSHKMHVHALHCISCWLTAENMAFFIRSPLEVPIQRTESGCYSIYTSQYGVLVNNIYIYISYRNFGVHGRGRTQLTVCAARQPEIGQHERKKNQSRAACSWLHRTTVRVSRVRGRTLSQPPDLAHRSS